MLVVTKHAMLASERILLSKIMFSLSCWNRVVVLIAAVSIFSLFTSEAIAAEQVVLKYHVLRETISVEELSTFAQTGEISRRLRVNLALARQDLKLIRKYLTEPVQVNPILLDRLLNSPVGNVFLDEISQVIHTPSRKADRQALRAALVLSARQDRTITLIEILENYPTQVVEVEGDRLEDISRFLRRLGERLPKF